MVFIVFFCVQCRILHWFLVIIDELIDHILHFVF